MQESKDSVRLEESIEGAELPPLKSSFGEKGPGELPSHSKNLISREIRFCQTPGHLEIHCASKEKTIKLG